MDDTTFLHRDEAPFSDDVWEEIDETVVGAAKAQMSARKLLHTEGPYGLGTRSIPGPDRVVDTGGEDDATTLSASCDLPVARIQRRFTLSIRDIATFEQRGLPLDTDPAAEAAMECAHCEDDLIFNGSDAVGVDGLLNADGINSTKTKTWDEVGTAIEDVISAVTLLDETGFHGPYTLALAPDAYNRLFRRYKAGSMTELDHIREIVTDGVVKAPAINEGGVLLASGAQFAVIVLGQDLSAGFVGPADNVYEFTVSESVSLDLARPEAVCVLEPKSS